MTLLELLVSIAVGLVLLGMTVWIAAGVVRLVRNLIASVGCFHPLGLGGGGGGGGGGGIGMFGRERV
jgi:hypothetical protein